MYVANDKEICAEVRKDSFSNEFVEHSSTFVESRTPKAVENIRALKAHLD